MFMYCTVNFLYCIKNYTSMFIYALKKMCLFHFSGDNTISQVCNTSILVGGIDIYGEDLETVQPKAMVNDKIVSLLFQ